MSRNIGLLNEKPLHAALKEWYAQPEDRFEVSVDGFVIDVVQGNLLVEIQTGDFASIKSKLIKLTGAHRVRLVYPIAQEKWIVKLAKDGSGEVSRRKSPKRGIVEEVFWELVSFPQLLSSPNFSLEVLLIQEEEVRRYEGRRRWWRRGWVTEERRLLEVVGRRLFERPADMGELLPSKLKEPFTTADLAGAMGGGRKLAQKMAYCLRRMGVIKQVGQRGRANLYARAAAQVMVGGAIADPLRHRLAGQVRRGGASPNGCYRNGIDREEHINTASSRQAGRVEVEK